MKVIAITFVVVAVAFAFAAPPAEVVTTLAPNATLPANATNATGVTNATVVTTTELPKTGSRDGRSYVELVYRRSGVTYEIEIPRRVFDVYVYPSVTREIEITV